jgi:hypothetical protein
MYGPVLDARPIYKWGKSIARVHTLRAERTYMNYSRYQDNNYFSLSTGFFTGQEWRKPITDRLYFLHGPETGGYFNSGVKLHRTLRQACAINWRVLYKAGEHLNIALSHPNVDSARLSASQTANGTKVG